MNDQPPPASASTAALSSRLQLAVVSDVAAEFAERVVEAFHCRPGERFGLALTGGPVAAECYERLSTHGETQIDWWQVELFLVDECAVEADHVDSHERLVRAMLLDRVGAAHRVHTLRDQHSRDEVANTVAARSLDLIHLDLGPDGRLSSIFPRAPFGPVGSTPVVQLRDPLDRVRPDRFCLHPDVIARAGCILITAVGASVADALNAVRHGHDVPGHHLPPDRVVWLADHAAARA
ncbi:MAG: 6-phosphogluconolactonase [Acidimicrobiales bacterium]